MIKGVTLRGLEVFEALAATGSVAQAAATTGLSQPAVSQHLKILREAGLVASTREGRRRIYRLQPEGLKAVFAWVQDFEDFWSERLEALDSLLDELPDEEPEASDEGGSDG